MILAPESRYNYSELFDGFFGTRQPVKLRDNDSDSFHVVTDADSKRIDLIAWKYYRDVNLWWVIAEINNIINPLHIPAGTILRIPDYERVLMKIIHD